MKLLYICWIFAVAQAAILGIDYGHQFTKAIMVAPGIPFEIVFTDEGKRKDSSALTLKPILKGKKLIDAERLYGSQIGSLCTRFPESCASNLKRLLGKSVEDDVAAEYLQTHFGVTLVRDASRNTTLLRLGTGENAAEFTIEELAAMSLNNLKDRVLKTLDFNPDAQSKAEDVAIAVGPDASQLEREVYLDVLDLADFSSILGLVDEGTAVAIAFALNAKLADEQYDGKTLHYVVYDVGAGSTSATLFSYTPFENRTIELDIKSVGYDESLGGEFLTAEVYKLLFQELCNQFGFDTSAELPPRLASRLMETSEKAKIILSANLDYKSTLESFYEDKDFKIQLTRGEYEDALSGQRERFIQPILDALSNNPDGKLETSDISSVILNGGSSRTPFIQKQLVHLLGSEDKIAKVVNTDEACALGTAIQAYNWKTISRSSPVIVNDRIHKSFEVSVGLHEPVPVFEKGSTASNESVVELGPLEDNLDITLFENGQAFASYNLSGLQQRSKSMSCSSGEKELYGTFVIDRSKIFKLSKVYIKCASASEDNLVAENSTSASNSTSAKKLRSVPVTLPARKFTNLRPLNKLEKQKISKVLGELKLRDLEKVRFEETKNLLEAACYSLRNNIEDNRQLLESDMGEETLEELIDLANEVVEWLEYDADDVDIAIIEEKFENIIGHKNNVERYIKMQSVDLTKERLHTLSEQSNKIASRVQDFLLEFGQQVSQLREKYEAESIDFAKENEKIMNLIYGKDKMRSLKIDEMFSALKLSLKELAAILELSDKEFAKLAKGELWDIVETILFLTEAIPEEIVTLQENHEKRMNYLLSQLDKIKMRNAQKEFRRKLKQEKELEEKASEEAQSQAEGGDYKDENDTKVMTEEMEAENSSISIEEESDKSQAENSEEAPNHDEL